MSNVIDLASHRRTQWSNLPRVTAPGAAIESDGTPWRVLEVLPEGAAICTKPSGRGRQAIPLTMLRRAP